jgi:polyketide cyclase/dehydrase/lipid transport protein
MAHSEISELIPAPSSAVFDLLHDYSRRLQWDTLLQAAYLEDGATVAAKGVTAVCVGRKSLGSTTLKTVYVTFERPTLAAVKMVNTPMLFESWAASIRHEDISAHESRLTYKFHFTARPHFLRFALDPLMKRLFIWETRKRLRALKAFFTRQHRDAVIKVA